MSMPERDLESLTLHESPQMVTGEKDKTTREVLSEAFHSLPQIQAELISVIKRNCLSSRVLQCSRSGRPACHRCRRGGLVLIGGALEMSLILENLICSVVQGSSQSQSPQS